AADHDQCDARRRGRGGSVRGSDVDPERDRQGRQGEQRREERVGDQRTLAQPGRQAGGGGVHALQCRSSQSSSTLPWSEAFLLLTEDGAPLTPGGSELVGGGPARPARGRQGVAGMPLRQRRGSAAELRAYRLVIAPAAQAAAPRAPLTGGEGAFDRPPQRPQLP